MITTFVDRKTRSLLFHVGCEALDAVDDAATMHGLHFRQLGFCALRPVSAQMAFAAFGADYFARAGQAKTLGRRLMGLQLHFASFGFARHSDLLLSDKIRSAAFILNHDFTSFVREHHGA